MTALRSHPQLWLHEHIEQVRRASAAILRRHSAAVMGDDLEAVAAITASLHDGGKSSRMFQEYIADPAHYRGSSELKMHTPLSLVLALLMRPLADPLDMLTISLAVRGHHGQLATIRAQGFSPVGAATDLTEINSATMTRILIQQIETLDLDAVQAELGMRMTEEVRSALRENPRQALIQARRFLSQEVLAAWRSLDPDHKMVFRLRTQLVYSILLEADKAFLAVQDPARYLHTTDHFWDPQWIGGLLGGPARPDSGATDAIRAEVRDRVLQTAREVREHAAIYSLTAPTGIGKTLLAASWALELRAVAQSHGPTPQIIVVLPFLSIIDQTVGTYQKILNRSEDRFDQSWLMASHSLADREYGVDLEGSEQSFFIDTWRSDVVITTYDQFLMALFDDRARYQMRFHHLVDALIIMDEVQSLPTQLWMPLAGVLESLGKLSGTRVLLMSATLPAIVTSAVPLLSDYGDIFGRFGRYRLHLDLESKPLDAFIRDEVLPRVAEWASTGARVLITLNTRASARAVWAAVNEVLSQDAVPLYFITADVTPKDRLASVQAIKQDQPCIVVSTQTVEAGVDIDMSLVIRDFAPWDSIVQIAGRCNREGARPREMVEIWSLTNEAGRAYADSVYDPIRLGLTRELLSSAIELNEEATLELSLAYFQGLASRKNTGAEYLNQYRDFQPRDSVRTLLRGTERQQYTLLVLDEDPALDPDARAVQAIVDRWARREAWRKLAARIASVSIQIWARPGFNPRQIADPWFGDLWALRSSYYHASGGLNIEGDTQIW